jgi:hypothetical protein
MGIDYHHNGFKLSLGKEIDCNSDAEEKVRKTMKYDKLRLKYVSRISN